MRLQALSFSFIIASLLLATPRAEAAPRSNPRVLQAQLDQIGGPAAPGPLALKLASKGFSLGSPVLIRIFKQLVPATDLKPKPPGVVELWMKNGEKYQLFETYPIDNFSGILGPKLREGDGQAPEGFYSVTPELMNPDSAYYLGMNIGYPNAFDAGYGRTGSFIMIHGAGKSRGCYALSNESIREIYLLSHSALTLNQREIPVHVFPFPLNAENLAAMNELPLQYYWDHLREGYDAFETNRVPPLIEVISGRYVVRPLN